jgi:16S rRNA (guanine527-N7)-methyltransferase
MPIDRELARLAQEICRVSLSEAQLQAFDWYAAELAVYNQRFNLTAITSPEQVRVRHFVDSLSCARVLGPRPEGRLVDIGAGAGFPSLPLKIAFPSLSVSLVESVGKKADFCRRVVQELGLTGVEVLHGRAEQVGRQPEHREGHDWAVARAVARLPTLLEYMLPLLRLGGTAVAMKGESGPAEAHASDRALELLGGKLRQVLMVELPGVVEQHNLIVIEKHSTTPERYPRRTGIPAKRPLS